MTEVNKTTWLGTVNVWSASGEKVLDEAVVETMVKGLMSDRTVRLTRNVMQHIATVSGAGLLPNNDIMIFLVFVHLTTFGAAITSQQAVSSEEREHLEAFLRLLALYSDNEEDETKKEALTAVRSSFEHQFHASVDKRTEGLEEKEGASDHIGGATLLLQLRGVFHAWNVKQQGDDRRVRIPMPHSWIRHVIKTYWEAYSGSRTFDVILSLLMNLLEYSSPLYKKVALITLANLLELSTTLANTEQFSRLSSILVETFYSPDAEVAQLSVSLASFLAANTKAEPGSTFNFVRIRIPTHSATEAVSNLMNATEDEMEFVSIIFLFLCSFFFFYVYPYLLSLSGLEGTSGPWAGLFATCCSFIFLPILFFSSALFCIVLASTVLSCFLTFTCQFRTNALKRSSRSNTMCSPSFKNWYTPTWMEMIRLNKALSKRSLVVLP